MFRKLFAFEWYYFTHKPVVYLTAIAFFGAGYLAGSTSGFTFPNVYKNSAYEITYLTGLFSLLAIFSVTFFVAQTALRETDSRFAPLIYSKPVSRFIYLSARFAALLFFVILSFIPVAAGIFTGNFFSGLPADKTGPFLGINYLFPLLVLALPNLLLCVAIVCATAWLTRNKLIIYVSGLFIYIVYIIGSAFSNSPLIAGAATPSPALMSLSAKLDPFGMAAFFEQTRYWTAAERNAQQLSLTGNFLINRMIWTAFAVFLTAFSWYRYTFRNMPEKRKKEKKSMQERAVKQLVFPVSLETDSPKHYRQTVKSFVQLDLLKIVKGIPFVLIMILMTCLVSVELYNVIHGDPRLGVNYAQTGLIVSAIMETIPFFVLLVILFYSNEITWNSRGSRFDQLENATPFSRGAIFLAHIFSLSVIPISLVVYSCFIGFIFQLSGGIYRIDVLLYLSLLYYIALPMILCSVLLLALQTMIRQRYASLGLGAFIIFLVSTKFGLLLGLTHPLLRFGNTFSVLHGGMNGFGKYPIAFHWQMVFNAGIAIFMIALLSEKRIKKYGIALSLSMVLVAGIYIFNQVNIREPRYSQNEINDWKQAYEIKYKRFENIPLPVTTRASANIDLFPENQSYRVKGRYTLVNQTGMKIDTLLFYLSAETKLLSITIDAPAASRRDSAFHHIIYRLQKPLLPGDSLHAEFMFTSGWSVFGKFTPFNAILSNGTFIRISRYFPQIGYHAENEITNSIERGKRNMPPQPGVKKLESPVADPYPYAFTDLDLTVSTAGNQMVVCSGELVGNWKHRGRNYFRYVSDRPMPFRFAVSSARYAVKKDMYHHIPVEIYYDPAHAVNVHALIAEAKNTLDYCEKSFGSYPHKSVRFAEISSFVEGFAATAYPSVVYMKENTGFYSNLFKAPASDVINGLAGHELSHAWWGSASIAPEYKEGGWVLTETLAGYTALMRYRQAYGQEAALETVKQHLDQYLSSRSFSYEPPLFKTGYTTPYLPYNKGLVVMYQLAMMAGEGTINKALRSLLSKHRYPLPPPDTQSLLDELYAVTPATLHAKIDELFKQVVLYDMKFTAADVTVANTGYNVNALATVNRYQEDGAGRKKASPFNGEITIAVYTDDNRRTVQQFRVNQGTISVAMHLAHKPVRIALDPDLLLTDVFSGDNQKQF